MAIIITKFCVPPVPPFGAVCKYFYICTHKFLNSDPNYWHLPVISSSNMLKETIHVEHFVKNEVKEHSEL